MPYESVDVVTEDGVRLHAWLCYQEAPQAPTCDTPPYTLVFFHGNAGNMGHRLDILCGMHEQLAVNILIVDYRGYGDSEDGGGPTEERLLRDAVATYAWLVRRIKRPTASESALVASLNRILLFGRSLGGAVALRLAERLHELLEGGGCGADGGDALPLPAGLVLENTFTSLRDMAAALLPCLSVLGPALSPLLLDPWRSLDRLERLAERRPELAWCLISGLQDEIVPARQMAELHRALRQHRPRVLELCRFPGGRHNDTTDEPGYWESFRKFLSLLDAPAAELLAPDVEQEAERPT